MVSFTSLLALCSAAMTAVAMPQFTNATGHARRDITVTTSTTGTDGGYYYQLYMEETSGATLTVDANSYSLTWTADSVDVVAGVGWQPGSAQVINYSGSFSTDGNAYLAVYGWTTDPLIEYYIVESYGDYNPGSAATLLGSVESDGGTYDIYQTVRTDQPSILGTSTFDQYWSVRTEKRVSGTVTTANHFNAWADLGLTLGTFNYQILATEGYESDGSSSITVSSGGTSSSGSTTTTTTSTSAVSTSTGTVADYGQCGGIGWTGATTCASPYTCEELNDYYYQCL